MTMAATIDETRRVVTDLNRLLHRMETYNPNNLSSYSLRGRATMAQEMWAELEQLEYSHGDAAVLRDRVQLACRKAEELAVKKKDTEIDWVDEIFFKPTRQESSTDKETVKEDDEIEESVLDGSEGGTDEERHAQPRAHQSSRQEDVEEIQKAQREQLESEISHMAAQLKASTQHMNSTLRSQTDNLQEMEDLATENVDKVGKAAENVHEHNQKAWSSTIATWTLMLIIFGTFLFCMITMRLAPKRADTSLPCLVNCQPNEKSSQQRSMARMEDLRLKQVEIETENKIMEKELAEREKKERNEEAQRQKEEEAERRAHKSREENEAEGAHRQDGERTRQEQEAAAEVNLAEAAAGQQEAPVELAEKEDFDDNDDNDDDEDLERAREKLRLQAETARQVAEERLTAAKVARRIEEARKEAAEKRLQERADLALKRQQEEKRKEELRLNEEDRQQVERERQGVEKKEQDQKLEQEQQSKAAEAERQRVEKERRDVEESRKQDERQRKEREHQHTEAKKKEEQKLAQEKQRKAAEAENQQVEQDRRDVEEIRKQDESQRVERERQEAEAKKNEEQKLAQEKQRKVAEAEHQRVEKERRDVEEIRKQDESQRVERERQEAEAEKKEEQKLAQEKQRKAAEAEHQRVEQDHRDVEEKRKQDKILAQEKQRKATEAEKTSETSRECGIYDDCINESDKMNEAQSEENVCISGECAAVNGPGNESGDGFAESDVHAAAITGDIDVLRRYLELKPEFAVHKDGNGWAPIHEASYAKHAEVVNFLAQLPNVDVNSRTGQDGGNALWLVRDFPQGHPVVNSLKAAGAQVMAPVEADLGFTEADVLRAANEGDTKALSRYVDEKPEWINVVDANGWTPLHEAIRNQHAATISWIVESGGNLNIRTGGTGEGWSPLGMAHDLYGTDHAVSQILTRMGAKDLRPEKKY